MGLPKGSPLSPVLFNIYTKGLANLNSNGVANVLTLADDGLIYKTARTTEAVQVVQSQLDKTSKWCMVPGSFINPEKQCSGVPLTTNQQADQSPM